MRTLRPALNLPVFLSAILLTMCLLTQDQSGSATTVLSAGAASQAKVFVFVQRSERHVKYSHSDDFLKARNDLLDYLKEKNVAIAVDEFGGRNSAEAATPMDTVMNIARDAKASSVLYAEVDRPITKWIKISMQCLDITGKRLWQEEASSGGGFSGAHGFEETAKKLHAVLDKHVGQQGLPTLTAQESAQKP